MIILVISIISGLGFVSILSKQVGFLFKILVAPALGLFVFTQVSIILALLIGVSTVTIASSLILTSVISALTFFKFRRNLELEKNWSSNFSKVFLAVLLIVTFMISYLWLTQALEFSQGVYKTGGGGMYGDTALHAAYSSKLATGQFPAQDPLFAGQTLVYPLANDMLSALLKITGLNFNLAFSLPQVLFLVGFLTLMYVIVKNFTSDFGFVVSILILLLGWGSGAFFFLRDWGFSGISFWQFLTNDYTDFARYNLFFHNILTGLILPERSFMPGLFLGCLMFFNFWEYFKKKNTILLVVNGLILGALPIWHTHTFIFFSITSVIFSIWILLRDGFDKIWHFIIMYLVAFLFAIPFLILILSSHNLSNFFHFSPGWQNGSENILIFWLKNSLLVIPFAIKGLWFIPKEQRVFFVPALVIFVFANVVIFQPWDWDNIKLLSWSFLFFAILNGVFVAKIFKKGVFLKILAILIVFISVLSGVLSLTLQLKNHYVIYDTSDIDLANWAKANTRISDVFIIDPVPNHPIPGLAGRSVYMGYPGHLWVHGIDYRAREAINSQILMGNFNLIKNLEVPISYVVSPAGKGQLKNFGPFRVFANQKYDVLEVDKMSN